MCFRNMEEICENFVNLGKLEIWKRWKKIGKYTGLEHRQTLRACDFHFNLQIEIENENIDK